MRITNNTIARNYTRNLNINQSRLNSYSEKLTTMRKFNSMGEDTTAGIRALQIRRSLDQAASHLDVAKSVKSQFTAAEGQMMNVVAIGQDVAARYTTALNGTNSATEREIMATEIEALMGQILSCANGQFASRYQFGGTNTTNPPFAAIYDDNDKVIGLSYQGVNVAEMTDSKGNVLPEYQYLFDDAAYVDIGLGLKGDENGYAVTTSVFKSTLNGLDFLGVGENNIYLICNEIVDALRDPGFQNEGHYAELLNRMRTAYENVTVEVTNLGASYQFLDYSIDRLTDEIINMQERQSDVEQADAAETIMNWKMQEFVYTASLQMGQSLLQPTLFNFVSL